jgi:hypothetical protein
VIARMVAARGGATPRLGKNRPPSLFSPERFAEAGRSHRTKEWVYHGWATPG